VTRPFCRPLVGKAVTRRQIQGLSNGQTAVSPLFAGGGYNCRHSWVAMTPGRGATRGDPAGDTLRHLGGEPGRKGGPMSAANTQRKAIIGEDHTFIWTAPGPLTTTPTLTLTKPDGTDIVDLGLPVAGPASLSAIAADRRTLTIGSLSPTNACTGPVFGAVAVVGQDGGYSIAQVEAFNSDTEIVLAQPLPHPIDVELGATVQWMTYVATVATADLGATPLRNIAWRMRFDRRFNGLGVGIGDGVPRRAAARPRAVRHRADRTRTSRRSCPTCWCRGGKTRWRRSGRWRSRWWSRRCPCGWTRGPTRTSCPVGSS